MIDWGSLFRRPGRTRDIHFLREIVNRFRELVGLNNAALELIADMGDKLSGDYVFDSQYLRDVVARLEETVYKIVYSLNAISDRKYPRLFDAFEAAKANITAEMDSRLVIPKSDYVLGLDKVSLDISDGTGEKMATLGEMKRLGLKVPEGFVVSAYSCRRFFEHNGIDADRFIEEAGALSGDALEEAAREMRKRIVGGRVPPDLKRALQEALSALGRPKSLAVRSSALGEDGGRSFAGLYETRLNVPAAEFLSAYKEVLASLFSSQVLAYRDEQLSLPRKTAMSVGGMLMVPAAVSGVCYSLNPSTPEKDRMVVSASWGLGKMVVEGEGQIDQFELSKSPPYDVLSRRIGRKERRYVLSPGGVEAVPVPERDREVPCLGEEDLRRLAGMVKRVEGYLKCFQDVEWAMDARGEIYLLQARPLHIVHYKKERRSDAAVAAARRHRVLLRGEGVVACRGVAAGSVVVVNRREDHKDFPQGAVLVAKHTSPVLSKLMPKASAVVTDVGAVTGHLATVAREFRVPAIVDTGSATRVLKPGMEVTVDAKENVVYEGTVGELLRSELFIDDPYEDAFEFRLLRRLLRRIAPLRLTAPDAAEFTPENCSTYHDIIRFAHEMAVREVAASLDPRRLGGEMPSRKMDLSVPLDLLVIDIGGGLSTPPGSAAATIGELACVPLRLLLSALTAPGVWHSEPVDLDFNGFMSSLTRTAATSASPAGAEGRNVAIVSKEYVNLSLRLGYHFNMVDVYLSENRNENYIYFRFLGGVTDITRRSRRARLLQEILERNDFAVEMKGDLVVSRTKKMEPREMEKRLLMLGRLIGFTRQLDVLLRSDEDIDKHVERFESKFASPAEEREGRSDAPETAR
ncbi:MAG: PEP/pyruvate-binding domain-containing protein [Elusimicrobiota bacterium]